MNAIAESDHVGRAGVLDLDQRALARGVGLRERLGDHAVETSALELGEPADRGLAVTGGARDVQRVRHVGQKRLQSRPALGERRREQIVVTFGEQIEGDEHRRGLGGQSGHAGCCGMDALAERLPVQALRTLGPGGDHDLAVEQAGPGEQRRDGLDQLREVARQRLRAAGSDLDALAVPRDEAAEAVPLGLVQQPAGGLGRVGDGRCGLGEHRRGDLVAHGSILARSPSRRKSTGDSVATQDERRRLDGSTADPGGAPGAEVQIVLSCGRGQPKRSLSAWGSPASASAVRAACQPAMPLTPGPGGVAEEAR